MDLGFLGDIGSVISDAGKWIGNNKDWLKPVASLGSGLLANNSQNSTRDAYVDALRQAQTNDYNTQKTNYDAYTKWLMEKNAADGASSSAAAARSNANAAANEKSRLAGVNAAKSQTQKTYKDMRKYIDPYADMGLRIRPQIESGYTEALKGLSTLLGTQMTPGAVAAGTAPITPKAAWNVGAPVPSWMGK